MSEDTTELDKLKLLLGIDVETVDLKTDILLEFALNSTKEIVTNYCNIDDIPIGLSNTVLRMAVDLYRNEQLGEKETPQVVTSIDTGDTSTSYGSGYQSDFSTSLLKNYNKQLNRYRKVRF